MTDLEAAITKRAWLRELREFYRLEGNWERVREVSEQIQALEAEAYGPCL